MGLVAKLQIMQQPTTLVTFCQIRRVQLQEYRLRVSIIASSIVFIIIAINCEVAFKLDHQVLQTEQAQAVDCHSYVLNSLNLALYLRGQCIHSNFSVHLLRKLIIIGLAFMHEVNMSPPLSLARFFLTKQLIYKSKIEKHSVSLDIFVSDTSIARNFHLPGLEKKRFNYIKTHILFLDQILVFVLLKMKEYLRIRVLSYHRDKKLSALTNGWESDNAYRKNPSKGC